MAEEFTTSALIQAWLKITTAPSTAEAVVLTSLAASVQARMERYMGRKIYTATYTERYSGHGGTELTLKQSPITAVTTLKIDETTITAAANSNASGYMFDDDAVSLMQGRFARGNRNIYVVYTAGYSAVPKELSMAATQQAAYEYQTRGRIGQKSITVQQQTVSFLTDAFLPGVKLVLDNYKRYTRTY